VLDLEEPNGGKVKLSKTHSTNQPTRGDRQAWHIDQRTRDHFIDLVRQNPQPSRHVPRSSHGMKILTISENGRLIRWEKSNMVLLVDRLEAIKESAWAYHKLSAPRTYGIAYVALTQGPECGGKASTRYLVSMDADRSLDGVHGILVCCVIIRCGGLCICSSGLEKPPTNIQTLSYQRVSLTMCQKDNAKLLI
jgi:hypothetical protein